MQRCEECGFEYDLAEAPTAGPLTVERVAELALVLSSRRDHLRTRRQLSRWSPLEYGCHVRDMLFVQRERVLAARRMDCASSTTATPSNNRPESHVSSPRPRNCSPTTSLAWRPRTGAEPSCTTTQRGSHERFAGWPCTPCTSCTTTSSTLAVNSECQPRHSQSDERDGRQERHTCRSVLVEVARVRCSVCALWRVPDRRFGRSR
jgi:hypothetical protein